MSIETIVWVGPYAEWLIPVVDKKVDNCPKPQECPSPQSGYCQTCGIKTELRFSLQKGDGVGVPPYEVIGDVLSLVGSNHHDEVTIKGKRYRRKQFVPNAKRPGCNRKMYFPSWEYKTDSLDMTNIDIKTELDWFASAYKEELDKLAENYKEPPKIKWGIVRWVS